jgi:hypothetical protein
MNTTQRGLAVYSPIYKQARKESSNLTWKMQTVNINTPIYSKTLHNPDHKNTGGKRYIAWLSLVAIKI